MSKHDQAPEKVEQQIPVNKMQQSNTRIAIRMLLVFYLAYLIYTLFRGYLEERNPLLLAAVVVFLVAEAVIVVASLRRWKREQAAIALQAQMLMEETSEEDAGAEEDQL